MATPQLRKNSKWWYGGWMVNGKKITANLQVVVEGKRPTSRADLGDVRFRVSREKAQAKLDEIVRESLTNKQTGVLAQAVYKARTGQSVPSLRLDELVDSWEELPRRRQDMSTGHIAACRTNLRHFVAFINQHYPTVATLTDVTHDMAQAFMVGERNRGVSGRTFNVALYKTRSDVITKRLGRVFKAAGFADDSDDTQTGDPKSSNAPAEALTEAEMKSRGRERIRDCSQSDVVRANMRTVFDLYMDGKATAEIASEMGMSKGSVSCYFKRIEDAVGFPVVRQRRVKRIGKARGAIHALRPGLKKVNQRGFHSFRATWVTLALTAGVPMDLVRKVTGHTTADTVMTHYFQPGQDAFRKTLIAAMPTLLTGGATAPTREEQMKTILDEMSATTWKQCQARLYALIT